MKINGWILTLAATCAVLMSGCGSEQMSKEEENQLKTGLSQGGDASKLTPEQRKQMEEYMGKAKTSAPPKEPQ